MNDLLARRYVTLAEALVRAANDLIRATSANVVAVPLDRERTVWVVAGPLQGICDLMVADKLAPGLHELPARAANDSIV